MRPIFISCLALAACVTTSAERPRPSDAPSPRPPAPTTVATAPAAPAPASASAAPTASQPAPPASPASPAPADTGPKPPFTVIDPAPTSAGAPAPLYADLFKKGARWTIVFTSTHSADGRTERTTSRGACGVREVTTRAWAIVSQIACEQLDASGGGEPLSGYWVATAVGLFFFYDDPKETPPPLTDEQLVMKASPAPLDAEHTYDDGSGIHVLIGAESGSYCRTRSIWSGDESSSKVCIARGKGFVGGNWGWAGGSSHDTVFRATPAP